MQLCFPEYHGPEGDYKAAVEFIQKRFLGLDQQRSVNRKIYPYETCATDTKNVERIFATVRDILMNKAMSNVFG